MFLHIGNDVMISKREIIGIFDAKNFKQTENLSVTIMSLPKGQKIKSAVLTTDKIYFSPITSGTLQKRSELSFGADL